jgi:hypothetical protein
MTIRKHILTIGGSGGFVLYIESALTPSSSTYSNILLITYIIIILTSLVILKYSNKKNVSYLLLAGIGFSTYFISSLLLLILRTTFNTVTHFNSILDYVDLGISVIKGGILLSFILAFLVWIMPPK